MNRCLYTDWPTKAEETGSKSKKQQRRWLSNINASEDADPRALHAATAAAAAETTADDWQTSADATWTESAPLEQFRPTVTTKIRQTNTREQEAGYGAKRDGMEEQREPRWIHGTSRSRTWPTSLLDIKRRRASCRCPQPPTVHPTPINRRRPADVTIDGWCRWRQCRFDGAGYQLASAAISCCVRC